MSEPTSAEYGRYDELSEYVLREALAMGGEVVGALVVVIGAPGSNGFSVSALTPDLTYHLPAILRNIALGIEDANRQQANK